MSTATPTVTLLLFAGAREAAGTARVQVAGATVADVLAVAIERFGPAFAAVLGCARVWVDGDEPIDGPATALHPGAEVAVLPPVSGG